MLEGYVRLPSYYRIYTADIFTAECYSTKADRTAAMEMFESFFGIWDYNTMVNRAAASTTTVRRQKGTNDDTCHN